MMKMNRTRTKQKTPRLTLLPLVVLSGAISPALGGITPDMAKTRLAVHVWARQNAKIPDPLQRQEVIALFDKAREVYRKTAF